MVLFCVSKGSMPSLPKSCLPPMVPYFTARQTECEEIIGHLTSGSVRIVSIWGSPGFGKTSVAIAVGHHLHFQGLPVYYFSLRGLQSKADLASKLLSLFRSPIASEQQNQQYPSIDDEISFLFSKFSEPFTIILDNADELLSGGSEVKEDFTHFLADILRQTEKLTLVIITMESLEFMNVQFQGHQGVRISPLDESSSHNLVNELLPNVTATDCKRISEICGRVPLATRLLCSFISKDDADLSQVLDDLMESLQNRNIVEMLDNPDYPRSLRLKLFFNSSFQRLSVQEKEALVSLSVLPESFDLTVAAAVLGISQISVAKRILHNLRRKSLLESSFEPWTFSMHPVIKLFVQQQVKRNFSLAHRLKQAALFGEEHASTADSYHSLGDIQHAQGGISSAIRFKQRALDIRRKRLKEEHASTADSYHSLGVTQHQQGDLSSALQSKQRALDISLKLFGEENSGTADSYHSLGVTQHQQGDLSSALQSKQRALDIRRKLFGEEHSSTADSYYSLGATQIAQGDFSLALQSTKRALGIRLKLFGEDHSSTADSYHLLGLTQRSLGDFSSALQSAQRALDTRLKLFGEEHSETADSFHSLGDTQHAQGDFTSALQSVQRALHIRLKLFGEEHSETADSYHSLGDTQNSLGDFSSALQSAQRALDIRLKLFGEEHSETADSYHSLGYTQHSLGDFSSALQSAQRALDIRLKLFGEEHSETADSYHSLGDTQHALGDFSSALQSTWRALQIRHRLFGEELSSTVDGHNSLQETRDTQDDFTLAGQIC